MLITEMLTKLKLIRISLGEPWRIMAGFKTKKNGMKYFTKPNCIALNPVFMGSDPAKPAPAKADKATGGVIYDAIPQYIINKWTAKGYKPLFTNAGAKINARKT